MDLGGPSVKDNKRERERLKTSLSLVSNEALSPLFIAWKAGLKFSFPGILEIFRGRVREKESSKSCLSASEKAVIKHFVSLAEPKAHG